MRTQQPQRLTHNPALRCPVLLPPQLGLRTLSVGLANTLLMQLPEPFRRSTFAAAAAGPCIPPAAAGDDEAAPVAPAAPECPAGCVYAPWSVTALATLLQRCGSSCSIVMRHTPRCCVVRSIMACAARPSQESTHQQEQEDRLALLLLMSPGRLPACADPAPHSSCTVMALPHQHLAAYCTTAPPLSILAPPPPPPNPHLCCCVLQVQRQVCNRSWPCTC